MIILGLIVVSGCSKVYVCYDGSEKKIRSQCPILKTEITEQEAGKSMDQFGTAVAQAKGDSYTRVNLYQKNLTWYSGVLFTNKQAQTVKESTFKIDGKTGTVTCDTGCEYVDFK